MALTLFKFFVSPPACFCQLILEEVTYEEVLLYRAEQLTERFLRINPKHQVPALLDGGDVIVESRDIARFLLDTYCRDRPELDHLYPVDPQGRARVDSALQASIPIHVHVEKAVMFSQVTPHAGMPTPAPTSATWWSCFAPPFVC